MKVRCWIFAICMVLLIPMSLMAKEKLVFSTFQNAGISLVYNQILHEAYNHIGVDIEIKEYPGERALRMADDGETDGEAARLTIISQKFKNLIQIPVPLQTLKIMAFTKNPDLSINKWEDLFPYTKKPNKIITLIGYKYVENKLRSMNIRYLSSSDFPKIIKILNSNRVDVAILTQLDGLHTVKSLKIKGIHVSESSLGSSYLYHFIHKKNKDLVPKITASLKKMEEEGRIKEIFEQVWTDLKTY